MVDDNTWYVAIQKMGDRFYSFIGAGGESYRDYKSHALRHGIEVVAEQFGVDDNTINRVTGFDGEGRRVQGDSLLTRFVKRISSGEDLEVQEELSKLCQS